MNKNKTSRGVIYYEFKDTRNHLCSLQKISNGTEDCIWLGLNSSSPTMLIPGKGLVDASHLIHSEINFNTRMHLNVEQVKELIEKLQKFVDTGEI